MNEKEKLGAAPPRTTYPIEGMCICDHNEPAHTKTDHAMERAFPGQKWNGCTQCRCPYFRQEDEISITMNDAVRASVWMNDASVSEPPKAPLLCETCQLRPAVCAVGKGGHIGSVSICRQCWDLDWADLSDDGREE